jgi:hypothetical protein
MSGPFVTRHKDEILDFVRQAGARRGYEHHWERIARTEDVEGSSVEVTFTIARLAAEIGRSLFQKYWGELDVQILDDGEGLRVEWWR